MVTDKLIEQWHGIVRSEQKKLGADPNSETTRPYSAANKTQRFRDLQALTAVEAKMLEHGFAELRLQGHRWLSNYGPLLIRVFVAHMPTYIELSLIGEGQGGDNLEVAEYHCTFVEDKPVLEECSFDVAGLVLPKHG